MQFFLALIGFFFLVCTFLLAVFVWKVRRRMKQFHDAVQDSLNDKAFQRKADKNYYQKQQNQGPIFDEEYFKGDPNSWRNKQQQAQQAQQTRRTTHAAGGVTIIDDRDPEKVNKKIFSSDEGEYVDFKEE